MKESEVTEMRNLLSFFCGFLGAYVAFEESEGKKFAPQIKDNLRRADHLLGHVRDSQEAGQEAVELVNAARKNGGRQWTK